MFKKLILATALIGLVGCAFDKDNDANNAAELADRQRQLSSYSRVVGFYTGKLTTSTTQQDVELRLFTLESEAGTNANGDDRYRIVLRGNYKKINPVGPGYNFKARYIPETGELILTNEATTLSADDIHTVNAKVFGQKIVGEAKSISGVIGVLEMTMSSSQSTKPGNNEENEYYERLYREYKAIEGVYTGENIFNGKATYRMTVKLEAIKVNTGSRAVPQIVGEFTRQDDPNGSLTLNLSAVYQPELTPAVLNLTGKPRYNTSTPYEASFDGVIVNGEYTGSWKTNIQGFKGNFTLKKAN
ncbi:hypothetical protein QJS83_12585 [Bdellovibrio sp. 22V]|uniref:hypothetical protein n=1 Tax=Bdellovibrio TaxID=958 RepID=UPI002543E63F|nr:hypothetical protein [Bdellovibrio sp. 22V]WII71299.1 hypothetical protein QJS83_12585 [Bdellovibrio sp. 22V]